MDLTYQLTKLTNFDRKIRNFLKILGHTIHDTMDFHPKDLPVSKTYDLKDEKDANDAVADMVAWIQKIEKDGFRILMPKETRNCKEWDILLQQE